MNKLLRRGIIDLFHCYDTRTDGIIATLSSIMSTREGIFKLQKLKRFLIGSGFFWIFSWSVFGSLIGAKINLILATQANVTWLQSVQRSLLTTAHAHMNNMSVTLILMALSLNLIREFVSEKIIRLICVTNLISIPLFGIGLLFEACYPTTQGSFSSWTVLVAVGGIAYMITILLWSVFFMLGAMAK